MFCEETAVYAANRAMRKLGIKEEPSKEIFSGDLENGMFMGEIASFPPIVEGGKYIVSLDSGDYEATCKVFTIENEEQTLVYYCLGNGTFMNLPGAEDTGEQFIVVFFTETVGETHGSAAMVLDKTKEYPNTGKHCSVSTIATATPIDPKYLPGTMEVFKLQDYGIDFYEIYMSGQTVTELDCSAFVADVYKALNAGKVPYVFFHDMFPNYIPVAVSENTVELSVLTTIDGMTRFDVLITWVNVHLVGTNLSSQE